MESIVMAWLMVPYCVLVFCGCSGMLDSTTPLLIALAAFLLDYTLQPTWLPPNLHKFIGTA